MKFLKENGLFMVIALGLAAFLLLGGKGDLSGADARALVKNGALLLDVRTPQEFAAGHLDGAINISHTALTGSEAVLSPKRDADVVVYCHSGRRSAQAVKALREAGFTRVHDLGAMSNW